MVISIMTEWAKSLKAVLFYSRAEKKSLIFGFPVKWKANTSCFCAKG